VPRLHDADDRRKREGRVIGRLLCLIRPHIWRRARKGEDPARKFCTRCGESVALNKRKKEA
jgi:hypothetical protein